MKLKINTLILFAVAFVMFSGGNSAKAPQQYSTALLKDGPGSILLSDGGGPMCIPDTPCGYKFGVVPDGSRLSAEILLTGGPGPMCIPDTPCEYKFGVVPDGSRFSAKILLTGEPRTLCPPDTGCGHTYDTSMKNSILS